jgi:hypothetical protein
LKPQTQEELKQLQAYLQRTDISDKDRQDAERGLNDWFWQSLIDDGLLNDDRREPPATT